MAADYHYVSTWQLRAPIEQVWTAITDLEHLPAWYPGVQQVQMLAPGDAQGSGSRRLYSYRDLIELKVIKALLDAGIKLESVRGAFDYLVKPVAPDRMMQALRNSTELVQHAEREIALGQRVHHDAKAEDVVHLREAGVLLAHLAVDRIDRARPFLRVARIMRR